MASSFIVGDHFRTKVSELLEKTSAPEDLRTLLSAVLENTQPTRLPFSTVRKLKKFLQDEGYYMEPLCLTANDPQLLSVNIHPKADLRLFPCVHT